MRLSPSPQDRVGRGRRRGATTMEATLLLPLFLIFWFGIIDWGLALFVHETVVQRLNAAGRWAIVNSYDTSKITKVLLHGDPNSALGGSAWFSLQDPTVNVQLLGNVATNDRRVVITISNYQWMHFTPFFGVRYFGRPLTVSVPVEDLTT